MVDLWGYLFTLLPNNKIISNKITILVYNHLEKKLYINGISYNIFFINNIF